MPRKKVVIGLLGVKLDQAPEKSRWGAWRPSVGICQQDDLLIDRFELIADEKNRKLSAQISKDIESTSPETQVRTHSIKISNPWDFEEVYATLHQFTRDYEFDTDKEDYLIHITTGTHVAQICLFLLTESRHLPGQLLQSSPPRRSDKHGGSSGHYRIIDLDLSRYDQLASRFAQEQVESLAFLKSGIDTKNKHFNELIQRIEQVSLSTTAPILLTGPTGVGKSQLARRIFQLKRKREQVSGELVEVNCATLRGEQAMSTLFGHVKGAFTGAVTNRDGLMKAADGGVLFLDEVGELGLDEQAMLLRAIEDKTFMPVGSDKPTSSDFQLIAGTNRDLTQQVAAGTFREDLLARINLWAFELPGLADRRDDIAPNIEYELQSYTATHGRKVTLNREAQKRFLDFALDPATPWRGNFRDLNAAITRMATLSPTGRINRQAVSEEIERLEKSWSRTTEASGGETVSLSNFMSDEEIAKLDLFDQLQLARVIAVCRSSKTLSAAGRTLFNVSRLAKQKPNDADRLRKYLAKFGLSWDSVANP